MPKYRADELHPPAARASTPSCSSARARRRRRRLARRSRRELGGGARALGRAGSTSASCETGRAARRDRRLPGQVRDQEHRAGRRAAAPHRAGRGRRRAPVREHVRTFMRTAFELDAIATAARARAAARRRPAAGRRDRLEPGRARDPRAARDGHRRAGAPAPARRQRAHGRVVRLLRPRPERAARRSSSSSTAASACTWPTSPRSARPKRRARRRDRRDPRLGACAHAFGYRGHCLTKSRRYSTTFKALRAAREAWVHEQILARSTRRRRSARSPTAEERAPWRSSVDGVGHVTAADAYLAASAAARAREQRRLAREAARDGLMAGLADEIAGRCGDTWGGGDRGR